jgi:hypothetical protein
MKAVRHLDSLARRFRHEKPKTASETESKTIAQK